MLKSDDTHDICDGNNEHYDVRKYSFTLENRFKPVMDTAKNAKIQSIMTSKPLRTGSQLPFSEKFCVNSLWILT